MMSKYQGSKPIQATQNGQNQNQKEIDMKSNANAQSGRNQQSLKSHKTMKIETSINLQEIKSKQQDQRQTPKSGQKPEINITLQKIRQQSQNGKLVSNPFDEIDRNQQIDTLKLQNLSASNPLQSQTEHNQSPSKDMKDQQHYFTASFKNETPGKGNYQNHHSQNNSQKSSSCLMYDCAGGAQVDSGNKGYQSNYNMYDEHVCDEFCVHEEDNIGQEIGEIKKSESYSMKMQQRISRSNSPTITKNIHQERSESPKDRGKSASRLQINTFNPKLSTKNSENRNFISSASNKNFQIISMNQSNTIQSTKNQNLIGFHTTSSKQLNASNNYTQSSMYVNQFYQNYSSLEDNEDQFNTLKYGSIKQHQSNNTLQNQSSQQQQNFMLIDQNEISPQNQHGNGFNQSAIMSQIGAAVGKKYVNNLSKEQTNLRLTRNESQRIHHTHNNFQPISSFRENEKSKGKRSRDQTASPKKSPVKSNSKNKRVESIFSEKIEKIQRLQQRVINQSRRENELSPKRPNVLSCEAREELIMKTLEVKKYEEQDEDYIDDKEEDYVEPDPLRQIENDIQGQSVGVYFSKHDLNYQNSSHLKNSLKDLNIQTQQQQYLDISAINKGDQSGFLLRSPQKNTVIHNQTTHSLYSTQSGFFNKQQDDIYLGSLNNFVDAKIQTLHVMIQEKRKLELMIEEKQILLKTTKQDKINQQKQEEIFMKELELCQQRQQNLMDQNKDLEYQINLINEKTLEKNNEYQTQFGDMDHTLSKSRKLYNDLEKTLNDEQIQQSQLKNQWLQDIDNLREVHKEVDQTIKILKTKTDHKNNEEKNRLQFMRNKGNDVLKVIQDDKVYSERNISQTRDKSGNHRFTSTKSQTCNLYKTQTINTQHQNDQSQATVIIKEERSTSKIALRNEKQNQISHQLQSYMQQKISKHKNQNISCISINQNEDQNQNGNDQYQGNQSHMNINVNRQEFRDKSADITLNRTKNYEENQPVFKIIKERDQNIQAASFRKDSDQVLSSCKSSADLNRQQVQGGKANDEKKTQYFDKNAKKHNFDINNPREKQLQQSKSSVKINLHNENQASSKQHNLHDNKQTQKNNQTSKQQYQSSHHSNNLNNQKISQGKDLQATYATVNLF